MTLYIVRTTGNLHKGTVTLCDSAKPWIATSEMLTWALCLKRLGLKKTLLMTYRWRYSPTIRGNDEFAIAKHPPQGWGDVSVGQVLAKEPM